jgi:hypothetical protein
LPWGELDKLSPFFNIFAGLSMMSILVPFLIFYLFFSYCYYRIARKVGVSAPWLAFVPILQIWTLFACAGKSTGMTILLLILLFVPLVNIIVIIYVWMMIAENLGKNKWIGLLILVPFVNIILPIWFAFSRGGGAVSRGEAGGMGELADLGGEPDIPDLDFDLEEEEAPSKGKEETPQYEDDWQLPDEETGGGQKADDWQLPTETDEGEQSVGDWQLPEEEQ